MFIIDFIFCFLGPFLKDLRNKDVSHVQKKFLFVILVRKLSLVVAQTFRMLLQGLSLRDVLMKMEKFMR